MKKLFLIYLLTIISVYSQKNEKFENKNLSIITKNINANKLWITLSQDFNSNMLFFNLFQDSKFTNEKHFEFPKNQGFYFLTINYDLKLQYREIIYYKINPENEKLTFEFYKKNNKLFCDLSSKEYYELNKKVILYKIYNEKIKENIKNFRKINKNK